MDGDCGEKADQVGHWIVLKEGRKVLWRLKEMHEDEALRRNSTPISRNTRLHIYQSHLGSSDGTTFKTRATVKRNAMKESVRGLAAPPRYGRESTAAGEEAIAQPNVNVGPTKIR
jgi:hypothetical protein